MNGTEEEGYAPPPSRIVESGLETVLENWTSFQALILDNMDTITPSATEVMLQLSIQSTAVLQNSNKVVGFYVDAAKSAGADVAGLVVDIAGRQRMLTQRLAKETLLIGLDVNKEANLAALEGTVALFSESHDGILRGLAFVGIDPLTNMCTLWQMRSVSARWGEMRPLLLSILDNSVANQADLESIAVMNMALLREMKDAVKLYISNDNDCNFAPDITASSWSQLINEGGGQRMMGQKATRLFFQIAKKVKQTESVIDLSSTLSTGSSKLRLLIEGSELDAVPAPPTQAIADKLTSLWTVWVQFSDALIENGRVLPDDVEMDAQVVGRVGRLSRQTLDLMNEAVELMVSVCLTYMPSIKPTVINIAGRQRMLMQQMSKEALAVALNQEAAHNAIRVDLTVEMWLAAHRALVLGTAGDKCDTSTWVDVGSHCGSCRVRATQLEHEVGNEEKYMGKCSAFCAAQGLECVAQQEDVADDCAAEDNWIASCDAAVGKQGGKSSSDLICTCKQGDGMTLLVDRVPGVTESSAPDALDRTTSACLLRQMNTALNRFNDLRPVVQDVAQRAAFMSPQQLQAKLEQIDALNVPAFAAMHAAVGMFASRTDQCDLTMTLSEWHQVFRKMSRSQLLIEKMATEYMFRALQIIRTDMPEDNTRRLQEGSQTQDYQSPESTMLADIGELENLLYVFTYGNTSDHVSTPPSQEIADAIILIGDAWPALKALLEATAVRNKVGQVIELSTQLATMAGVATGFYATMISNFAVHSNDTVWQGIAKANLQAAHVQRLVRDATMFNFADCFECQAQRTSLPDSIAAFQEAMTFDQKDILAAASAEKMVAAWGIMKRTLENMLASYQDMQQSPELRVLVEVFEEAAEVREYAERTAHFLITSTETTTRITLELLVPLPLTGSWSAGKSMRTAILIAQDIINTQQQILPGYNIISNFFDDQCGKTSARNVVLKENKANSNIIAVGGLGCSRSCQEVADITPFINLPLLSYACAGAFKPDEETRDLSDNTTMADFARMGNNMRQTPALVKGLANLFGWSQVTIVVEDTDSSKAKANYLKDQLSGIMEDGENIDIIEDRSTDFASARAVAEDFRGKKRRVIFMIGDEGFKRRVVCASRIVGANLGITWLTEGTESEGWLTSNSESDVGGQCTAAEMEESYQGALNIAGRSWTSEHEEEAPLDCFQDHTAKSFRELVDQALSNGFPEGDNSTIVEHRYDVAAKAADGTCVLAYTIARLLSAGRTPEELRNTESTERYKEFVQSMKQDTRFRGASGRVEFQGNDVPGSLSVRQRRPNPDEMTMAMQPYVMQEIGIAFANGTMVLDLNGGVNDEAFKPALEDEKAEFPFEVIQVLVVFMFICCPFCIGICYVWRRFSQKRSVDTPGRNDAKV